MSYHTTPDNWPRAAAQALAERHQPSRAPSVHVGPTPRPEYAPEPLSAPRRRPSAALRGQARALPTSGPVGYVLDWPQEG